VVIWTRDAKRYEHKSTAPPAGLVPDARFDAKSFAVESLRRVVIVSDGITESVSSSSDTLGALEIICGKPVEVFEALPESEIRHKIDQLGPERDDVSVAWIDFSPDVSGGHR
jgi:serine phosphatase RsbU (regulator of sigma subunit)